MIKKILKFLLQFLIGAAIGIAIVILIGVDAEKDSSVRFFVFLIGLALTFFGFILHLILHETGHLIGGLLSGYKFVSFRVFNIMIIKDNEKLKIKKYNLPGTGGQCLMESPENENVFALYYLGGSLMNLFISVIFFALFSHNLWIMLILVVPGIFGIINILPLKMEGIATDGYVFNSLRKNKKSRRANWIVLKAYARISAGERMKELPAEWFEFSDDCDFNDPVAGNLATMGLARLIDLHNFDEAKILAEEILGKGEKLIELLKNETRCELLFLKILNEEEIENLYTPELKKYMGTTKTHLSRHRLMYAYEKLVSRDNEKAAEALAAFEKTCPNYPIVSEIENERELIKVIDNISEERRKRT
ncbi:MAG: hypothetical protein LBI27_02360 [Clostridiales bacterium]|jgi:hypothetical protein|nr:hypothetical protein [Clostridiales bacterium]